MTQPYFMGIDGGASNLRIAITDDNLNTTVTYSDSTANPNVIGHDTAQNHIQAAIKKTLAEANLSASNITAVGAGIAGASKLHSENWIIETITPALPDTLLIPSSDLEIALVGALGQRHGILVLAGTGSAVFGSSPDGQILQIGGWGYLLDDAGGGYAIGLQALKRIIQDYEEHYAEFVDYQPSSLNAIILDHLELNSPRDIIGWLYRTTEPPVTRIAPLAKLIIAEADAGNWDAINLLQQAAIYMTANTDLIKRRLNYAYPPIAFGGGLLDNDNRLSQDLTERLGLPIRPIAQHTPAIGGALLAKLEWKAQQNL